MLGYSRSLLRTATAGRTAHHQNGAQENNWKHLWGCLQEQIAVRVVRITKQQGSEFTYLTASEWKDILERQGFQIDQFREFRFHPHNHALFICHRPSQGPWPEILGR